MSDIKQRLVDVLNFPPMFTMEKAKLDELCRDALEAITLLEGNMENYVVPRFAEVASRIMAGQMGGEYSSNRDFQGLARDACDAAAALLKEIASRRSLGEGS